MCSEVRALVILIVPFLPVHLDWYLVQGLNDYHRCCTRNPWTLPDWNSDYRSNHRWLLRKSIIQNTFQLPVFIQKRPIHALVRSLMCKSITLRIIISQWNVIVFKRHDFQYFLCLFIYLNIITSNLQHSNWSLSKSNNKSPNGWCSIVKTIQNRFFVDFPKRKVKWNVKMFSTELIAYERRIMESERFERVVVRETVAAYFMNMNLDSWNILFRKDFRDSIDEYHCYGPELSSNGQSNYRETTINIKHIQVSKCRDSCHDQFRVSLPVEYSRCVSVCVCIPTHYISIKLAQHHHECP